MSVRLRRTMRVVASISILAAACSILAGGAGAGPTGSALRFPGTATGSYVSVPYSPAFAIPSDFTVSADFRWDGTPGYQAIVSQPREDDGAVGTGWALSINDGAPCFSVIAQGNDNRGACSNDPAQPGVWTHVDGVYAGDQTVIWIDGSPAFSASWPDADVEYDVPADLLIGREFITDLTDRAFHGDIDNVRISSGDYNNPLTTIASYSFDENGGSTVSDSSGNGHDGTLSALNAPTFFPLIPVTTAHIGYCSAAGNHNPFTGQPYPPGKFLDLEAGQPLVDPAYTGAKPAIFVQGVGLTCDPPPPGFTDHGIVSESLHVAAVYEYWAHP